MLKLLLLFNLLILIGASETQFDLKEDLKKDRLMIANEHGDYNVNIVKNLKAFDAYAKLSLAGFKFEQQTAGKHVILKWTRATRPTLCIYEVISAIPADTIYQEKTMGWDSIAKKSVVKPGKQIKLKHSDFTFHTYIIKPANGKQLIYMTALSEGLQKYWIGDKEFYPLYESIALGIRFPNLKEILRLITSTKEPRKHRSLTASAPVSITN